MSKKLDRMPRARKIRFKIKRLNHSRLCVHKTPRHIYAQITTPCGSKVLASASSLDKAVRTQVKYTGNIAAAITVGEVLAVRAQQAGISKVAFDRSGFKYHGRVKALADAARSKGMEF